ncbi:hypothetical protein MCOR19_000745 [Pyricularia oryzae]|nr:hypothetical protein MCOR19_000745 [Pyricularia oryzae]KAI6456303.1 hypothetical protein MCOR18_011748 [Pyricularia oryzae]
MVRPSIVALAIALSSLQVAIAAEPPEFLYYVTKPLGCTIIGRVYIPSQAKLYSNKNYTDKKAERKKLSLYPIETKYFKDVLVKNKFAGLNPMFGADWTTTSGTLTKEGVGIPDHYGNVRVIDG